METLQEMIEAMQAQLDGVKADITWLHERVMELETKPATEVQPSADAPAGHEEAKHG